MRLPLFPLPNVVLLPGLVLPLYVFEPRYRELLARIRASGEPFGVTRLLAPSREGQPFESRSTRIGSLAHLREVVDHEDGTASVLVVGGERFEVLQFDASESYLSAEVRALPLPPGDAEVVQVLAGQVLEGALAIHATDAGYLRQNAPVDPLYLATYCAALLPLSADQREALLRARTLRERFEAMAAWLPLRTLN